MASMTDFRALCAELVTALHDAADDVEGWGNYASSYFQEKHDLAGNIARIHAQADQARTALAQPESQGPTDEELEDLADAMNVTGDPVPAMRRALELWSRPAIEPVPQQETDRG